MEGGRGANLVSLVVFVAGQQGVHGKQVKRNKLS